MPRSALPEDVLTAVASRPDLWHSFVEMTRWADDAKTGTIRVVFGDGGAVDLFREERLATGSKLAKALDPALQPVCPTCKIDMVEQDYGNKWLCEACDTTVTVWELRRLQSFRKKDGEPAQAR